MDFIISLLPKLDLWRSVVTVVLSNLSKRVTRSFDFLDKKTASIHAKRPLSIETESPL